MAATTTKLLEDTEDRNIFSTERNTQETSCDEGKKAKLRIYETDAEMRFLAMAC